MGTVRVGIYRDLLGQLLRAYKYHGREELALLLGGWLAEAIETATPANGAGAAVRAIGLRRTFGMGDATLAVIGFGAGRAGKEQGQEALNQEERENVGLRLGR